MVQVGLDSTLLFQIVQFLLIVLIVNFLIVKPVRTTMLKREQKLDLLKSKSNASLAAIEQKAREYDEKLEATRAEITEYQNRLRSDANARSQATLEKAKTESDAELASMRAQINSEANAVIDKLASETDMLAKQIVQMVTK